MSSFKPKAKSSVNQQVKAGIAAVRDFLSGRSGEASAADPTDAATRQVVAEELLTAMAGDESQTGDQPAQQQEKERARQLFVDHGYFEEAIEALRGAGSSADRVAAARALGLVGSQRGTAHLIAAMFDQDSEVRAAAEKALAQIGDPTVFASPSVDQEVAVVETLAIVEVEEPETAAAKPDEAPVVLDPNASKDEEALLVEEREVRERVAQLELQTAERATARQEAENDARWRIERENKLRDEAAALRAKEEELRKQAEEESARRRLEESKAIEAEQSARLQAESEAKRLAEEEINLRLEVKKLSEAADELSRRRAEMEKARVETTAAEQHAEAKHARDEANQRHQAELERLRNEEAALQATTEKTSAQRAEIAAAQTRADRDAEHLAEAQARMKAGEEARAKAEAERVKVEAELNERVEKEERLLAEARQRAQDEQARLDEELRRYSEEEKKRLADLEVARTKAELEARQRAEREQEIRSQLESLRISDAEVRKRIEDAETQRRAAEQAYRLVAEKVQRIEAEAHAAALEEEQILAKLETARRNAAVEAQARTDQEKRIKEEIEMFRRLEGEERPRLEALMLQRGAAEKSLQEIRERFSVEQEALNSAEQQRHILEEQRRRWVPEQVEAETVETAQVESQPVEREPVAETAPIEVVAETKRDVPPAIASYLHSVDPYKRAAAVAELARSNAKDAFSLIARCFDDHSPHVRNAAARALRKLEPTRTVDLFNRALEEGSADRRRNIGSAIAASGLASEAIENLIGENREETYNALSILFVMAKTGEVQPLVQAIEEHENDEVCRAVVKLLTLSGQSEIGDAALQRRVMGVAANRKKQSGKPDEIPEFRLRIAEVEVKRAINSQSPVASRQSAVDERQDTEDG